MANELNQKILEEVYKRLGQLPIMSWEYPRVAVCVLRERSISYADEVLPNLINIFAQGVTPIEMDYTRTDLARNKVSMHFLKTDFTHLLMLDIDHTHPMDIVQRLSRWFLYDKLSGGQLVEDGPAWVIGGLNFRRSYPHDPCAFVLDENGRVCAPKEWGDGLMRVNLLGTGSMMIAREALEAVPPPWFWNDYSQAWGDVYPGEDLGFCRKLIEHKIPVFADTTVTSPHITTRSIDENDYRAAIEKGAFSFQRLPDVE
jgi:hypothetical protein